MKNLSCLGSEPIISFGIIINITEAFNPKIQLGFMRSQNRRKGYEIDESSFIINDD